MSRKFIALELTEGEANHIVSLLNYAKESGDDFYAEILSDEIESQLEGMNK